MHASNGGKPCTDHLTETQGCGQESCAAAVDCVWGAWSDYGACSASCGGGIHTRDRSIAAAPRNGGKLCEAKSKTEVVPCNVEPCPTGCVDGQWESWSEW